MGRVYLVDIKKLALVLLLALFPLNIYAAQKVDINYPNSPTIYNKTLTLANTEYSQALPAGCTKFTVQCRTAYDVKLAFVSGESGTNYLTIKTDYWYWEDGILGTTRILYLQSAQAGVVVEIVVWY